MNRNETINLVADILQSVYSKQTRDCHENLAETIITVLEEEGVIDFPTSKDMGILKYLGHHPNLSKGCLASTCI